VLCCAHAHMPPPTPLQGNALAKQGKLEEAVAVYNKSLMENRNADTLKRLQVGAAARWPTCLM
jgi:pentatricopeptide repeat protein